MNDPAAKSGLWSFGGPEADIAAADAFAAAIAGTPYVMQQFPADQMGDRVYARVAILMDARRRFLTEYGK